MESNLTILMVEKDQAILAEWEKKLKDLDFKEVFVVLPDWQIDQVSLLGIDLALLGPSLDFETCLKCIHKLKIMNLSIPILTSCEDFFDSEDYPKTPFGQIHSIIPNPKSIDLLSKIKDVFDTQMESEQKPNLSILIGKSQGVINIRHKIQMVSKKDITVLITGETGTGKELIARCIHFQSARNQGPLVKINCTALPHELLESEVFGFQRGAFTGAYKNKPGRLEMAHEGTLFIDEIGELSLSLQVKFLQILEDKAFMRLGGTKDKVLDVRVVAATNADLGTMLREGNFRKDLYYRLNIMNINISPLRERKEDISLLVHYFLNKYCFELKKPTLGVPTKVENFFLSYGWPGNVRELENVIRRAIVMRDWSFVFDELNLENMDQTNESQTAVPGDSPFIVWPDDQIKTVFADSDFSLKKITKAYVSEAERQMILRALRETEWNRKKAALRLKVSYKTLLNRIDELKLKP